MKDADGNNGNHNMLQNEDSTSTDHLPPSTGHNVALNNGHDHNLEIVNLDSGNGIAKLVVASRAQLMDTSEHSEAATASNSSIVQNASSSSTSIVNHPDHGDGVILINTSDGSTVNGGTILTTNGPGIVATFIYDIMFNTVIYIFCC